MLQTSSLTVPVGFDSYLLLNVQNFSFHSYILLRYFPFQVSLYLNHYRQIFNIFFKVFIGFVTKIIVKIDTLKTIISANNTTPIIITFNLL
jgi:hypothetical protein